MLTKTAVLIVCFCIGFGGQLLAINPITDKYLAEHPGADANESIWQQGHSNPEYLKDPAFAADFKMVENYQKSIRSRPDTSFWLGAAIGLVAVCICYGIYRALAPRRGINSAKLLGQSWAAWSIVFSALQLARFFRMRDTNSFALWLLGVVVLYPLAFFAGWLYGKTVRYRNISNVTVTSTRQPATSQLTCNTTRFEVQAPTAPQPPFAIADAVDKVQAYATPQPPVALAGVRDMLGQVQPPPKSITSEAYTDVFDDEEFYRLEKAGSQSFYEKKGCRYFIQDRSFIFLNSSRELIQPPAKPQSPAAALTHEASLEHRLAELKGFFDKRLITAEDYASKKRDILGEL